MPSLSRLCAIPFTVFTCCAALEAAAQTQPLDVDFLKCGEIACVNVYQGEGVPHAQLVMHIWPKMGGLNSWDMTYVVDMPPDGSGAATTYLDNTMIEYFGPGSALTIPAQVTDQLYDVGIYVAEALTLATNSPYAQNLSWLPSDATVMELLENAISDVPPGVIQWDTANGNPPFPSGSSGGGMSDQAVGDLVVVLNCPGQSGCPPEWVVDTTTAQGRLVARENARDKRSQLKARFAQLLRQDAQPRINRLSSIQTAQSSAPSGCSTLALASAAADGVNACYDQCDICAAQAVDEVTYQENEKCVGMAAMFTFAAALASEGMTLFSGTTVFVGTQAICTRAHLTSIAGFKAARRDQCRKVCEYYVSLNE